MVFTVSRQILIGGRYDKWCLGFTTPRCLGKHPQCISRLAPTLLLKLGNPISNRFHHITRRFASG